MLKIDDFAIRELQPADEDMLLRWRNSDRVRDNMYTDHIISREEHAKWFRGALDEASSSFLTFLYLGRPVGLISFTGISSTHGHCMWAFYLGEVDVPKGTGAAMEYFALDHAFNKLGIRKLSCEVFLFNSSVIRLHKRFGFVQEGHMTAQYLKKGRYEDIVRLAKFGAGWTEERKGFNATIFSRP